jgi:hypothetical protein
MSRLILVALDEFCEKVAGVVLSEAEALAKTRELAPGTVPRIVTASEERGREGQREIETDTQTRGHKWGGQRGRASQRERWWGGGSEREVERLRTCNILI